MKLFNTMTRQKEEFVPLTPGEVKMYCCCLLYTSSKERIL